MATPVIPYEQQIAARFPPDESRVAQAVFAASASAASRGFAAESDSVVKMFPPDGGRQPLVAPLPATMPKAGGSTARGLSKSQADREQILRTFPMDETHIPQLVPKLQSP